MRIVLHDYAGHPLGVSLSRELAKRGHEILHLYSGSFETPHGEMERRPDDAPGFQIEALKLPRQTERTDLMRRRQADVAYGKLAVARIDRFDPDVVITANSLLEVVAPQQDWCRYNGVRHVFWAQDLVGVAGAKIVKRKMRVVGGMLGSAYAAWEQRLLAKSDHVVVISDDFREFVPVPPTRMTTIENWAPLDEYPVRPKDNPWSRRHGLESTRNVVYTGTLGMKHNPELLIKTAQRLAASSDVRLVVISAGDSITYLERRKQETGLDNLVLLPFQPFADLPDVLGTADVLIGLLEPDAGVFSVPSKVLGYLCAERPIVLAVPLQNLIARIVQSNDAGIVVAPDDEAGFMDGVQRLLAEPAQAGIHAINGRRYAESTFDIERIADRFVSEVL